MPTKEDSNFFRNETEASTMLIDRLNEDSDVFKHSMSR